MSDAAPAVGVDAPVENAPAVAAPVVETPTVEAPAQPAAQPAEQPANILEAEDDPAKVSPSDWPENWRELYAGEDEKTIKRLSRYASPKAAIDALFAAQDRIAKGDIGPKKPGKDAAPEEVKAWREANSLPETAQGYLDTLPNGLVIGEDDKEFLGEFAEAMHGEDAPPALVHKAVEWYYKTIEAQQQAQYDVDRAARAEAEDSLRAEWGPEYRRNVNSLKTFFDGMPNDAGKILANAMTPEGVSLLNNPDVVRALVGIVREVNPVATLIPGASNPTALADRLTEIRDLQRTNPKKYWSDAVQAEELKLIEAQMKLSARS